MNKIFLFALLCAISLSLRVSHSQDNQKLTIVGGWSGSQVDSEIDKYIREQFPDLADAKITKSQTQVVAGINYRYTYEKNGISWTITVWDQSWTKHRQVTSIQKVEEKVDSNGNKVQTTSTTRIESRKLSDIAKEYFQG